MNSQKFEYMLAIGIESEGEAPTVEFRPSLPRGACIGFVTSLSPGVLPARKRSRKGAGERLRTCWLGDGMGHDNLTVA